MILEHTKTINNTSKRAEVEHLFSLLATLVVQTECANWVIKSKLIEELMRKLLPLFKVEKDIISSKLYLSSLY